ncbi:NAD(P)H-binding protein [Oryzihumus sp.]|uniref:NAD(P)H-binding protein n=1 Tax=Oryzihumus sp. TaxID=1968903 RepID=UPI002ED998B2
MALWSLSGRGSEEQMRVVIVGGHGKVGLRLGRLLAERGDDAVGLVRAQDQTADLKGAGVEPVLLDLVAASVDELAAAFEGADAVVFSAGAGGKGGQQATNAIDGEGAVKAVAAAERAGVRRFLLVSVFMDAGRGRDLPDTFENYVRVKRASDVHLAASALAWTILRPGTLTDEPGTGRINLGPAIAYGAVSRDDVAATLAALLASPGTSGRVLELTEGEVPVAEAVARLVP